MGQKRDIHRSHSFFIFYFLTWIEEIEISLAQVKWETAELSGKIYALDTALVQFTIRLQEERKFVRKHLSAKSVQKFIDGVTLFHSGLFVPAMDTNSGLPSFDLLKKIDTEHVRILRCAEKEMQKVSVCFSDSMEHILSPGIFGWLKRFLLFFFLLFHFFFVKERKDKEGDAD